MRVLLVGFTLLFGAVVAQEGASPPVADDAVTTLDDAPPSLASFGVSAGFPAYQMVSSSGRAVATFRWNGCEWNQAGLSY